MSAHPRHRTVVRNGFRFDSPAFPVHPTGWMGFKARRACRKKGGHWWHPADAMILWKCCACGASRDGIPLDGR